MLKLSWHPAGKTRRELVELEHSINGQLDAGTVPDPEYWSAVLSRLGIWKVRPAQLANSRPRLSECAACLCTWLFICQMNELQSGGWHTHNVQASSIEGASNV